MKWAVRVLATRFVSTKRYFAWGSSMAARLRPRLAMHISMAFLEKLAGFMAVFETFSKKIPKGASQFSQIAQGGLQALS